MRIESLRIDRYGPLGEFGPRDFGGFTLVYAPNERGKTLIVDAILRLLFKRDLGRRIKDFGNIKRVDEKPEGYVVLEIDGRQIKLERNDSLTDHVDVTPVDFRNIFVVRDSDLSIRQEENYYTEVTERLAGLRTSEIERIKKALQKRGRLTNPSSTAELSSNVDTGHVGKKVEAALRCLVEIDRIQEELTKSDFDRLERVLADHIERSARVRRELVLLKEARVHDRFQTARNRLDTLDAIEGDLERLGHLFDVDFERWKQNERDVERLRQELGEAGQELVREKERLDILEDRESEVVVEVGRLDDRRRSYDDRIGPQLDEHERLASEITAGSANKRFWATGTGVSLCLLALSLVGNVVNPSAFFVALCVVFLVASGFLAWRLFAWKTLSAKLSGLCENMTRCAADLGIEYQSVEQLRTHRHDLEDRSIEAKRRLERMRIEHQASKSRVETLTERAAKHRENITVLYRGIDEVKRRSGFDTLREYGDALSKRTELLAQKQSLEAVLSNLIERDTTGANRDEWRKAVGDYFESAPDDGKIVSYDGARERELLAEVETSRQTRAELEEALASGRTLLRNLEREIREPLSAVSEDVVCRSAGDLARAGQILEEFVQTIQTEKSNALEALRIFEEIETEEKARVVELFGHGSTVSSYFRRITGGRYDVVGFDPESVEITVSGSGGEPVGADALSGGAMDQLYFAIRLSIAERLLSGEPGFLILDDPFIKSDHSRLEEQVALLRDITVSGWQVLYFTAKREVRELLEPDIASGRVGIVPLDGVPPGARERESTTIRPR